MNIQPVSSFWDEAARRVRAQTIVAPGVEGGDESPSVRREAPPAPVVLGNTEDELRLRLAEELDYARRMLDSMGETLAADPAVLMRHSTGLQSVDIVGQMLGHLAKVVRCASPEEAVDRIGMAELKARLQRRSIA